MEKNQFIYIEYASVDKLFSKVISSVTLDLATYELYIGTAIADNIPGHTILKVK